MIGHGGTLDECRPAPVPTEGCRKVEEDLGVCRAGIRGRVNQCTRFVPSTGCYQKRDSFLHNEQVGGVGMDKPLVSIGCSYFQGMMGRAVPQQSGMPTHTRHVDETQQAMLAWVITSIRLCLYNRDMLSTCLQTWNPWPRRISHTRGTLSPTG